MAQYRFDANHLTGYVLTEDENGDEIIHVMIYGGGGFYLSEKIAETKEKLDKILEEREKDHKEEMLRRVAQHELQIVLLKNARETKEIVKEVMDDQGDF